MTLALGITNAGEAGEGVIRARPDHLAIVTASGESVMTACDRLALQVAYARDLPSFLPFRPREPLRIEPALDRVERASADLTAKLRNCRGLVQFTLVVTAPEPVDVVGNTWLRRRAAVAGQMSAGTAFLERRLGEIGAHVIRSDDRRGFVHVVGAPTIAERIRDVLAVGRLGRGKTPIDGFSIAVTGPWPVFALLDGGAFS
jgi:hypothetical protein